MIEAPLAVTLAPSGERDGAAEAWTALERRAGDGALACSWDWTETWLRHYGDVVPHRFALAEGPDGPCGIALVTEGVGRRRGPIPLRTLHIGTAGEPPGHGIYVEYNRLLTEPAARGGFAAGLAQALRRERTWDELTLDGFAEEDARLLMQAEPRFAARREASPTADLRPARESGDVLSVVRKSVRERVRRSLRGFGEHEQEWAEDTGHGREILEELIGLHQRRWREVGAPGAFASPRAVAFHRELVGRLLPRGAAVLFRVRAGGQTIGCIYGFVERGRLLFYQSGFGSFDDPKLKPGLTVHALCMQACLERGLDEYDFLAGESRYKRELSNTERTLIWAGAGRRTPKMLLANGVLAAGRRARAAVRDMRRGDSGD